MKPTRLCHAEPSCVHTHSNRGCISDAVEKGWFRQQQPALLVGDAAAGADSSMGSSSFAGGLSCAPPDLAAILATAREVAAAMSYLHHKNMLHGDLTGNNVLLTAAPAEARGFTAKVRRQAGRRSKRGVAAHNSQMAGCVGLCKQRLRWLRAVFGARSAIMPRLACGMWAGGAAAGIPLYVHPRSLPCVCAPVRCWRCCCCCRCLTLACRAWSPTTHPSLRHAPTVSKGRGPGRG